MPGRSSPSGRRGEGRRQATDREYRDGHLKHGQMGTHAAPGPYWPCYQRGYGMRTRSSKIPRQGPRQLKDRRGLTSRLSFRGGNPRDRRT